MTCHLVEAITCRRRIKAIGFVSCLETNGNKNLERILQLELNISSSATPIRNRY